VMVGAGVNSFLSKILKRIFREPRPMLARSQGHVDPGFPSSHAHMLSYLSSYLCLTMEHTPMLLLLISFAIVGNLWRVYIGRHTLSQVCAGWVSGAIGSAGWFAVINKDCIAVIDAFVDSAVEIHPVISLLSFLGIAAFFFFFLLLHGHKVTGKLF